MTEIGGSWASQHRYVVIGLGLVTLFLAMFVVVEALQVPLLAESEAHDSEATWPAAFLGAGLLVADVVLPVPSSAVMIAQGAAFGFMVGSLLSLVGGTAATLVAYIVGWRSRGVVDRLVPAEQQLRGAQQLERYGISAIVATRPVPMLAEATAMLAGANGGLPWWKVAAAGAVGNLVPAAAYGAAGAYAATFVNGLAVFAGVLAVAGLIWVLQTLSARRRLVRAH